MKTILISIIVLLFSFPLQAQKTKQQSRFALPENKTQQRYTDSSFEAAVNSTDISIRRKAKEILTTIEARNLKEQHRLWFDILMRGYGEKRDNELISQNTLLKSVSSEKPLPAEQAFEDAQTLAKNGYTPENTAKLLQEKGINIVQQLLNQEYPLNMVLFSPTIIVGTVTESYDYHNPDEFSSVISIISVEQVLKGDTTLKNFSMKEPLGYDGPPRLCEKCSYIFFLMPTVLTLKSQGKQIPMMHIASRYPLNLADQDHPRHKGSAEKITAYCKNLWTFFQSLNVIPDKY